MFMVAFFAPYDRHSNESACDAALADLGVDVLPNISKIQEQLILDFAPSLSAMYAEETDFDDLREVMKHEVRQTSLETMTPRLTSRHGPTDITTPIQSKKRRAADPVTVSKHQALALTWALTHAPLGEYLRADELTQKDALTARWAHRALNFECIAFVAYSPAACVGDMLKQRATSVFSTRFLVLSEYVEMTEEADIVVYDPRDVLHA
jgi:hypothetical protein